MNRVLKYRLFGGSNSGELLAARFCDAVEAGKTPAEADLKKIAKALAVFLDDGGTEVKAAAFARKLGVTKKQGRQPNSTYLHLERYGRSVLEYQDLIEAGSTKSEAQKIVCEKHGIDRKTLRERTAKYADKVQVLRAMDGFVKRAMGASFPE